MHSRSLVYTQTTKTSAHDTRYSLSPCSIAQPFIPHGTHSLVFLLYVKFWNLYYKQIHKVLNGGYLLPVFQGVLLGLSNTAGVLAGVFGTAATGYILQHGSV